MTLMIASDIHGSRHYCDALLAAFARERADRLLLLGDLLYHGPRNDLPRDYSPRDVIAALSAVAPSLLCVRGNCDTEVDQMVLPFPIMADYALLDVCGQRLFATHGHHFHRDALPPHTAGDVLVYGHTHVPLCEVVDGVLCLNPGSVSLPKEGSPHGYMTLSPDGYCWKTLEGAVTRTHPLFTKEDSQ